jgi:hypothetical protein
MGSAAGENEQREQDEDPVELQIPAAPHEIDQGEGNRIIGGTDQQVGRDIGPEQRWCPQITMAMWHELAAG